MASGSGIYGPRGLLQAGEKSGVSLARLIVPDGQAQSLPLPYHHQKLPGAGDPGIDQVPLEKHEVLHGHRDHHGWKLRALGLVDGDRVGRRNLIQLAVVVSHQPAVVADGNFLLDRIDLPDDADVAVENFLFVIVLGLDHLVARLESPSEPLGGRLALPGRVQGPLERRVQLAHSDRSAIHRAQHLDIPDGVDSLPSGSCPGPA